MDLARCIEELSGLKVKDEQDPERDIEIAEIGLRSCAKLYEELLIGANPRPAVHPRIMKIHEEFIPWDEFEANLNALGTTLNLNHLGLVRMMLRSLWLASPSENIVD